MLIEQRKVNLDKNLFIWINIDLFQDLPPKIYL